MTNQNLETKDHENEIANFLRNLGFKEIDFNPIIKDGKYEIGEIDSLFEFMNYLFIIEVSAKRRLDNQKKNFFFSKWSDGYNLKILREKYNLKKKKVLRIYFDRITKTPENHAGLDHITKRRKGNKVVYIDIYKKFRDELSTNPSLARENFMKWLENS